MTVKHLPNRIPAELLRDCQRWSLPMIDNNGKVLSSAEKEARDRQAAQQRQQAEKIEDVALSRIPSTGITAQQLQELAEAAEQEGFEQGRQAGYDKGSAEGYEAGQQRGLMEMRSQLEEQQRRLVQLIDSLQQPLHQQDEQIEKLLLDTVITLTRSVVQRELQTDSSHILSLVKTAVAALPAGHQPLHIFLNPDDLARVEDGLREQSLAWPLRTDETLLPGGCRVETEESCVDFSVEKRLQSVLEQFVSKGLVSPLPEEADGGDTSPESLMAPLADETITGLPND